MSRRWRVLNAVVALGVYAGLTFASMAWGIPNGWIQQVTRVVLAQAVFGLSRSAVVGLYRRRHPPLRAIPRMPGWSVVFLTCGHWEAFPSHALWEAGLLLAADKLRSLELQCWRCRTPVMVRSMRDGPPIVASLSSAARRCVNFRDTVGIVHVSRAREQHGKQAHQDPARTGMSEDPTAPIREAMIATGMPQRHLARATETWDTTALIRDFEVLSYHAPYVVARKRDTGQLGSLEFTHSPRVYFGWQPDQ